MYDELFCTEAEVKDILIDLAKQTDEAPYVFVALREQSESSYVRRVTFVIQTREGNEELINLINKESMEQDRMLRFVKSDIDIQNGNLEVDYLFVVALISPNLK